MQGDVRTPPPPPTTTTKTLNFIKREKTSRACSRKRHILVLNSYPDPPPPFPKILYPPLPTQNPTLAYIMRTIFLPALIGFAMVWIGSETVRIGSATVRNGSATVRIGSAMVRIGSANGLAFWWNIGLRIDNGDPSAMQL